MKCGPHTLVTGKTDSGKSSIVKRLITEKFKRDLKYKEICLLDAKRDPGFYADFITDDPEEFLDYVEGKEDCLVIIDESGETVGAYAGPIRRIATMHRGLGHQAFFITQRAAMLDKTMREQCSNLICFRQSLSDAKELERTFPGLGPMIDLVPNLQQGEFIFVPSFGDCETGRAF